MARSLMRSDLTLLPVIEVSPFQFSTPSRELPAGPVAERRDEWHAYWLSCLADAGIRDLVPLRPGSWLVPAAEISVSALQSIVSSSHDAAIEEVPLLDGGLALLSGEEVLVEPQCCGDLSAYGEWDRASQYRGSDWDDIWIGHPWISMRFAEECLWFSDYREDGDDWNPRFGVSPDELQDALRIAVRALQHLERQLVSALSSASLSTNPEALARRLVAWPAWSSR